MRIATLALILFAVSKSAAQDSTYVLKVHCLYGSKTAKKFKETEGKWFGGKLGGHVGIENEPDQILNFLPHGKFHVFGKKYDRHSTFRIHSHHSFYALFGGSPDSVKKAIFYIPVTTHQKRIMDSISYAYINDTPYDYAFFGMRCGAATYEILGQLGIVEDYSITKTSRKIFYPRKLRKRLFRKAKSNSWHVDEIAGSKKRKWDKG